MKIGILAAGYYGQGLAHAFRQAGHDVLLYIRDEAKANAARKQFSFHRVTTTLPDVDDFDHVFITTPASAVLEMLDQIGHDHLHTNLFLVQKGQLVPVVFKSPAWQCVYYLTGAALSSSLQLDQTVGMILAGWSISPSAQDLVHSVTSFRAVWWSNPLDILLMNQIRTVSSIQRGIADQALSSQRSTRPLAISSIEKEGERIAELLGHGDFVHNDSPNAVRVNRILDADRILCANRNSRNHYFGDLVGGGCRLQEARQIVECNKGVVEGIDNVRLFAAQLCAHLDDLPYLHNTALILDGRRTVDEAMQDLEERRAGWL